MTHDKHVTYISYLKVDELLELQEPLSEGPEHDELLFITIHQVYELWFKQIIHELTSVIDLFSQDKVDESNIGTAIGRLERVAEIQKLLIEQIRVMESPDGLLSF